MAKTVEDGFEAFLKRLIPSKTEHKKVTKHKQTVHRCLKNKFKCSRFFDIGSYGNGTGVRHHSDTDYFAILPSDMLHHKSDVALRNTKDELKKTFPNTKIEVKTPVIKIHFGEFASETMEVIPCYFYGLEVTKLGDFQKFRIPYGDGNWYHSSPKAHKAYVEKQNKKFDGELKSLIRLIKAWKYYNDVPIESFYLELNATKYAEKEKSIYYDIDLMCFFRFLCEKKLADIRDPMGVSGLIPASKTPKMQEEALSKLNTALTRARKALEAKQKGNIKEALDWWHLLFNKKFKLKK